MGDNSKLKGTEQLQEKSPETGSSRYSSLLNPPFNNRELKISEAGMQRLVDQWTNSQLVIGDVTVCVSHGMQTRVFVWQTLCYACWLLCTKCTFVKGKKVYSIAAAISIQTIILCNEIVFVQFIISIVIRSRLVVTVVNDKSTIKSVVSCSLKSSLMIQCWYLNVSE